MVKRGVLLEEPQVEAIAASGVQEVRIRSVLTCETVNGVCGKCYGRDLARGTPVNMGEAVGVIAAQSIGEPGTQLTMRTFHIGGAAQIAEQSFIESNFEGTVKIRNRDIVKNSDGDEIAMSRNLAIAVIDQDGTERAVHRVPFGARLKVDDGDKIRRGQRMAEWDPYARPIITEVSGTVAFEDLVEGQSLSESIDEATGIAKRAVTDWRTTTRSGETLRPAIVIRSGNAIARLKRGGEARYVMPVDAIISVDPGSSIKAGDMLARVPTLSAKTRDITGGLPRVAELFEARRPKEAAIIAEIAGTVQFGKDYKNKYRINVVPADSKQEPVEYLIPKNRHVYVQEGDVVEKGDFIVDGNPAPHDILAIKGVEELAGYLVNEIQEVYRLQGVNINDKHIEVIVRQMLQKVEVDDPGETEHDHRRSDGQDRVRRDQRAHEGRRQEAGEGASGALGHHQGVAADPLLHLGGLVPGDHARAHRGRGQRQERYARRAQGERHRRPADPGGHRRGHGQGAHDRHQARRADREAARGGSGRGRSGGRGGQREGGRADRGTGAGGIEPRDKAKKRRGRREGGPFSCRSATEGPPRLEKSRFPGLPGVDEARPGRVETPHLCGRAVGAAGRCVQHRPRAPKRCL